MPMTPFIGVRISWLIVARNSDLARSASWAATASSFARTTDSSSARFASATEAYSEALRIATAAWATKLSSRSWSSGPNWNGW